MATAWVGREPAYGREDTPLCEAEQVEASQYELQLAFKKAALLRDAGRVEHVPVGGANPGATVSTSAEDFVGDAASLGVLTVASQRRLNRRSSPQRPTKVGERQTNRIMRANRF